MYKLLIVDDEKEIREGLAKWSWDAVGIEVAGCCSHGLEALQFVEERPVDIVVTDIRMPFMDGIELMTALNARYPFIRVVILSGYSDFEYAQKALKFGAIDYPLLKPLQFQTLARSCESRGTAARGEQAEFRVCSDVNTKPLTQKGSVPLYVALIVCSAVFLFPMYLAVVNAFSSWNTTPGLLPAGFHPENFKYAVTMIDFWKFGRNSLILLAITLGTSTFTSGLVGYAFARISAPGRNALFLIMLSTMMLPGIVTQIPQYILFHKYGLLDTFWPWVFWGIGGNAFYIFLYRQFFASVPKELEEAARIDGCSILRTYWNIFLPLPVVATVAIMNFQGSWGDFIGPFMFLKQDHYPLATALSTISYTQNGSKLVLQSVTTAAALLILLPVLIIYFLGQRFIVEGIVTTGVKG